MTEANTDYTIDFSVTFIHQWVSFELKHLAAALTESTNAFTYTLEHNMTENHPFLHMRGQTVNAHSVVESWGDLEGIYPPQTYRFTFQAVTAGDYIEPRFTIMERF